MWSVRGSLARLPNAHAIFLLQDSEDSNLYGFFCRREGNLHVCDCDYHTDILDPAMSMGKDEL